MQKGAAMLQYRFKIALNILIESNEISRLKKDRLFFFVLNEFI